MRKAATTPIQPSPAGAYCAMLCALLLLQAHMTFDCLDVEAHKDACYVIQLGINNNLSGEHAPKVGGHAAGQGGVGGEGG
jgi:hypothetical protein